MCCWKIQKNGKRKMATCRLPVRRLRATRLARARASPPTVDAARHAHPAHCSHSNRRPRSRLRFARLIPRSRARKRRPFVHSPPSNTSAAIAAAELRRSVAPPSPTRSSRHLRQKLRLVPAKLVRASLSFPGVPIVESVLARAGQFCAAVFPNAGTPLR